ncbi:MAG: hypothetical protein WC969_00890 [Elusimicrobiota bacterium]|jgi:spermidine synthase
MTPRAASVREVLAVTAAVSFSCLVYETAIAASFTSLTGDGVLWQSLTIALYLAAIGAGTWACSRRRAPASWPFLFAIELLLAFSGAAAVLGILSLENAYRFHAHFLLEPGEAPSAAAYAAVVFSAHGWTLLIGFLSGFEIPLLLGLCGKGEEEDDDGLHLVLGANYLGALAGTLAFTLVLLPRLDVVRSSLAAAALNLGVCLYVFFTGLVERSRRRAFLLSAAAAFIAVLGALSGPAERFHLRNFYANPLGLADGLRGLEVSDVLRRLLSSERDVEHIRSSRQAIDILARTRILSPVLAHFDPRVETDPGRPSGMSLYLDRRFQFHGATEALYHEFMAHVPVQLFKRVPRTVLVLGGGDGLLVRELLKYGPAVRRVVNVEYDPRIIALARSDPAFRRLNEGAYDDPRVQVVLDDAFIFARSARERFDAVYIDLPYPTNYDLTRLYSVEFYTNVARLLEDGGTVTLDFPLVPLDDRKPREAYRKNAVLFATLKAAGFRTLVPYGTQNRELVTWARAQRMGFTPSDYDPKLAKLLRRVETERFLRTHPGYRPPPGDDFFVVSNEEAEVETFVTCVKRPTGPDFRFKDYGIALHSLTPQRLFLLRFLRFPYDEAPGLVNSIFRPRLFEPEHLSDFAYQ